MVSNVCFSSDSFYVAGLENVRVFPLLRRPVADRGKLSHVLAVLLPTNLWMEISALPKQPIKFFQEERAKM